MKRHLYLLIPVLILFFTAVPARCSDQGLLNLLDAQMGAQETGDAREEGADDSGKKEALVSQLGRHLKADLRIRYIHYSSSPTRFVMDPDKREHEGEALLRWSTWAEKGLFSFHGGGWFEGGTQENTYQGISPVFEDESRKRRYAELNELYLVRSSVYGDLTLGKKVFHNGLAPVFSPANRYNPLDLTDPMDPKVFGSWMAAYDASIGDTTLNFTVLPVFQPKKLPSLWSRWVDTGLSGDIPDLSQYTREDLETGNALVDSLPFNITLASALQDDMLSILYSFWGLFLADAAASGELRAESDRLLGAIQNSPVAPVERLPRSGLSDAGWFTRVKHSVGLWDLFLSAYYGPGLYPVLKVEEQGSLLVLVKENPDVLNLAGGFSTTWRSLELHSEIVYNKTIKGRDEDYIQGVIGITYSDQTLARSLGLRRFDMIVEYAGEYVTSKQTADGYIATSRFIRLGRNDIFATLRLELTDDLACYGALDESLEDDARFYRIGAQYRIRPGLTLDVATEQFDGPLHTYYGHWSENDRLIAMLTWNF